MSLPPLQEVFVGDPPPETPLASDTPAAQNQATPVAADPNEVTLVIGSVRKTGWQSITIIRGIEIMPSQFRIAMTDRYPGDSAQTDIDPGDNCQLMIGSDLVLTGTIDRVRRRISKRGGTTITVLGRSLCRQLVDCAVIPAKVPNMQVSQSAAADMIKMLAAMYGISTKVVGGVGQAIIPQFNVNLGELVWPIVDRISKMGQFLAYDDTDGSLVLSPVGATAMASGFAEGVNIEEADYEVGVDQRYSEYQVYISTTYTLSDIAPLQALQTVIDNTMPPGRLLILLSEQNQLDPDLAIKRATWEMVRRYGRQNVLTVTADNWRDSAGTLWAINNTVQADSVHLKLPAKPWLIAQVAFRRDKTGTHANLVLMPPAAFQPEPLVIQPVDAQIAAARAKAAN